MNLGGLEWINKHLFRRTETGQTPNSVISKWTVQHKIEKHAGIGLFAHLIRKIGFVATSILLVPLFPFLLFYNIQIYLREKYKISYKPDSILAAIRHMKKKEETDKLDTMKKVLIDFEEIQNLHPSQAVKKITQHLHDRLTSNELEQQRGARLVLRALGREESFNAQWMTALQDSEIIKTLKFDGQGTFPKKFADGIEQKYPHLNVHDVQSLDWSKISHQVQKRRIPEKKRKKEIRKFEAFLKDLLKILKDQKTPRDQASKNQDLIEALRKALLSPVYQAMKEDSSEPIIKLLHRLSSDIWNKAPSMDAYRDVGRSVMDRFEIEDIEGDLQGRTLANHLKDSHTKMGKIHYTASGLFGSLHYAITHPMQTLGGLASEGGMARHIPGFFGLDEYDSHGTLSNNPSLQGTTDLSLKNGQTASVHNCYGGSPTIGDYKIAPEFEALIQAAENNQMAPVDLQDKNIPMMINYNNLQNLDKKEGEGPRSRALMLLNQKYSLSFRGTTFAKDSNFYLMRKSEDIVWNGIPREFGEHMQAQLDSSFDPQETGHGFYFHGSPEEWQPIFADVIANANAHFEALQQDDPVFWDELESADLQGAYQEYVYSLLNATIEIQSIKTLLERNIDDPLVMAISACKENIDRGGMENTKYLYNRLNETEREDRLALIIGAMHSRALSTRDRIILKSRMPQILNFMKTTSPQDFKANLMKLQLFHDLVVDSEYHPAITQEVDALTKK